MKGNLYCCLCFTFYALWNDRHHQFRCTTVYVNVRAKFEEVISGWMKLRKKNKGRKMTEKRDNPEMFVFVSDHVDDPQQLSVLAQGQKYGSLLETRPARSWYWKKKNPFCMPMHQTNISQLSQVKPCGSKTLIGPSLTAPGCRPTKWERLWGYMWYIDPGLWLSTQVANLTRNWILFLKQ